MFSAELNTIVRAPLASLFEVKITGTFPQRVLVNGALGNRSELGKSVSKQGVFAIALFKADEIAVFCV